MANPSNINSSTSNNNEHLCGSMPSKNSGNLVPSSEDGADANRQAPPACEDAKQDWRYVPKARKLWDGEALVSDYRPDVVAEAVARAHEEEQDFVKSRPAVGLGGYGGSEEFGGSKPRDSADAPGDHWDVFEDFEEEFEGTSTFRTSSKDSSLTFHSTTPAVQNAAAAPKGPPQLQPPQGLGAGYGAAPQGPRAGAPSVASLPKSLKELRYRGTWDIEARVLLYHCKGKKKKPFPYWIGKGTFPGETETSLNTAWGQHRVEGQRLWKEWVAVGGNDGKGE